MQSGDMQSGTAPVRRVVVSVGTDHHRFDRLMDWVEEWAPTAPADVVVFVQHGASRPPRHTEARPMLPKSELIELMNSATAILVQGGPGGIMDARRVGRLPIAVPRLAKLDEVVDDHQVTFCRHMVAVGKIALAESRDEVFAALNAALAEPEEWRVEDDSAHVSATVQTFGDAVDRLLVSERRTDSPRNRRLFRRARFAVAGIFRSH